MTAEATEGEDDMSWEMMSAMVEEGECAVSVYNVAASGCILPIRLLEGDSNDERRMRRGNCAGRLPVLPHFRLCSW